MLRLLPLDSLPAPVDYVAAAVWRRSRLLQLDMTSENHVFFHPRTTP
jgi:hypothetical protein